MKPRQSSDCWGRCPLRWRTTWVSGWRRSTTKTTAPVISAGTAKNTVPPVPGTKKSTAKTNIGPIA